MMRILGIAGLLLYGIANIFAGTYDLLVAHTLSVGADAALLGTGALLTTAAIFAIRRAPSAFGMAVASLVLASALAIFNERVLRLGHPSHHLVRGAYTVLVLWAVWRSLRSVRRESDD